MKIRRGDNFYSDANGYNYRVLGPHFSEFECEASDEYDDETGEFINYTPCIITAAEMRGLTGAKHVEFDDDND